MKKKLFSRALTWEEARQQCLLQGSDLAEMNDIDEQRVVTEFLNNGRKHFAFQEIQELLMANRS